jgi:hypothetical protein
MQRSMAMADDDNLDTRGAATAEAGERARRLDASQTAAGKRPGARGVIASGANRGIGFLYEDSETNNLVRLA